MIDSISFVTLMFAVIQTVVIVRRTGSPLSWKSILMYLVLLQLVLVLVQYTFVANERLTFVVLFIQLNMFMVVAYFFCTYAMRVLHRITLIRPVLIPGFVLIEAVLVVILGLEMFNASRKFIRTSRCLDLAWAIFTVIQCLLGVVLLVSVRVITHRAEAKTSTGNTQAKRRHFLGLVVAYTASSALLLAMQLIILLSFSDVESCTTFFTEQHGAHLLLSLVMFILDVAIPTWIVLVVFNSLSSRTAPAPLRAAIESDKGKPLPPEARPMLAYGGGLQPSFGTAESPPPQPQPVTTPPVSIQHQEIGGPMNPTRALGSVIVVAPGEATPPVKDSLPRSSGDSL